ncbi:MAG TPA: type III-B CRISPR module RAMP protein Cmr6 [Haliangium sp.]|nr:type III-B CRISPR module RAMP protein Cmr6 [Haliangium sp.]
MRDVLRKLRNYPEHLGLAHDVWAPVVSDHTSDEHGKLDRKDGEGWFKWLTDQCPTPDHYDRALARWQQSLTGPDDLAFHASTRGRLLVGHGNAAPSEVGITLHRTWGVPVIPGSSLAGLLAHYVAATLGPAGDSDAERSEREPFRPSARDERGNARDMPGDAYAYLFGVPPHRDAQGALRAQRGALIVHDAVWTPDGEPRPLARDVLTVHQRSYYDDANIWPSDHDSPNPVAFVSVPAGARFLFALSCPDAAWREWALERLQQALAEWGIGGKTAAGYGRFGSFTKVAASEHALVR